MFKILRRLVRPFMATIAHETAIAQTPTAPELQTVLYGAAYYHEYMPYERLDKDVAMMKAAGFNVVRLGESTWSL